MELAHYDCTVNNLWETLVWFRLMIFTTLGGLWFSLCWNWSFLLCHLQTVQNAAGLVTRKKWHEHITLVLGSCPVLRFYCLFLRVLTAWHQLTNQSFSTFIVQPEHWAQPTSCSCLSYDLDSKAEVIKLLLLFLPNCETASLLTSEIRRPLSILNPC